MNRELQAFWAWRGWLETVAETLGLLGSDRPLQSLRLNVSVEDTIQQQEHADLFYRLTLRSASKRAWSMSIYDVAPYNWAMLLTDSGFDVAKGLEKLKGDCLIVKKALRLKGDPDCQHRQARNVGQIQGSNFSPTE